MNFGAHISIAGGIDNAPERAREIGCECFQMFSKSPHGGKSLEITKEIADNFKKECRKYNLKNYYIHTPYYINLASANNRIYYGSISAIKEELNKADLIGAKAVVTHLGSAKDLGKKEAEKKLIEGLKKIFQKKEAKLPIGSLASAKIASKNKKAISPRRQSLSLEDSDEKAGNAIFLAGVPKRRLQQGEDEKVLLLLEITAGAGEIMGDAFEEMAYFIKEAEKDIPKNILSVCFDTAHAFASGYDLRNEKAVKKTFDEFDKIIRLERLGLIHCNDSLSDFGSRIDRHDNIGNGKIGMKGFRAILNELRLKNMDFIIETPNGKEKEDLEILKGMR